MSSNVIDAIATKCRTMSGIDGNCEVTRVHPRQRIFQLRIIWAAMLMGLFAFLVVVLVTGPNHSPPDPQMSKMLMYIVWGMLLAITPMAYVIRSIVYRQGRTEEGVAPQAYVTGNIIFWAMFEGVAFFGLVGTLINQGRVGPHLYAAAIAVAMIVVNFPRGAIMREE
jgi:hypothetical protein